MLLFMKRHTASFVTPTTADHCPAPLSLDQSALKDESQLFNNLHVSNIMRPTTQKLLVLEKEEMTLYVDQVLRCTALVQRRKKILDPIAFSIQPLLAVVKHRIF